MKLLLDAHALLWFATNDPKLSGNARSLIEEPDNEKLVSSAIAWEITIKASLGKLPFRAPVEEFLNTAIDDPTYNLLAIQVPHLATLTTLPFHHRDPFDRILIAQSLSEEVPVVSTDGAFDDYGVDRIW